MVQTQTRIMEEGPPIRSKQDKDLMNFYRLSLEEECERFKGWSRLPWRRRKERKFRAFLHLWWPNASDKKKNYCAKLLARL